MSRRLVLVATTGLIGAVACLALGIGLLGHAGNAMTLWGAMGSACRPSTSTQQEVTLPFDAVDTLEINLRATVRYEQGQKAEVVVSGDQSLLDHVRMEGGKLDLNCDAGWSAPLLDVRISGPTITNWSLNGDVELDLLNIDQPKLRFDIRGRGGVAASGVVQYIDLNISGSGKALLKNLTAQSARIDIRGSGDAQITARTSADVSISGNGNIDLFGNPVLRHSEIRGSGRVTQLP